VNYQSVEMEILGSMSGIIERNIKEEQSLPVARGARLKRVRNLANLSRKDMCSGDDLNINTYKGWEIARYGGLPQAGAFKIVERVGREGVTCTVEWLLYGTGSEPQLQIGLHKSINNQPTEIQEKLTEYQLIQNEILFFSNQFKNSINLKVNDDGMEPFYKKGEYLIGIKIEEKKIPSVIGENCIVGLRSGEILCRKLGRGRAGRYQLACLNFEADIEKPILYDVGLVFVAPVVWHRKPQFVGPR